MSNRTRQMLLSLPLLALMGTLPADADPLTAMVPFNSALQAGELDTVPVQAKDGTGMKIQPRPAPKPGKRTKPHIVKGVFGVKTKAGIAPTAARIRAAVPILLPTVKRVPLNVYTPSKKALRKSVHKGRMEGKAGRVMSAGPLLGAGSNLASSRAVAPQSFGAIAKHPYTTAAAYTSTNEPTNRMPFAATGTLFRVVNGTDAFTSCTASLIKKGLVLTAAHCLTKFGTGLSQPNNSLSMYFFPAFFDNAGPFGYWKSTKYYVPSTYQNGSDLCAVNAPGIVCENDLAIIAVAKNANGLYPGEVVGYYGYASNGYSVTSFLGKMTTQITQLGYPANIDNGLRMIRTDSLGYRQDPNNFVIGSDMFQGSSGGPWLTNFGYGDNVPVPATTIAKDTLGNIVQGVTSWATGVGGSSKWLGASRFGNNTAFPAGGLSNIDSLVAAACADYPDRC